MVTCGLLDPEFLETVTPFEAHSLSCARPGLHPFGKSPEGMRWVKVGEGKSATSSRLMWDKRGGVTGSHYLLFCPLASKSREPNPEI